MRKQTFSNFKKISYLYEILETIEVGLVLKSYMPKPIRHGGLSIRDNYIDDKFILQANLSSEDIKIPLLLSKKQRLKLAKKINTDGLSLVISEVYSKDNKPFKGTLCLVRGKKKQDKRNTIKNRERKIEISRTLKQY